MRIKYSILLSLLFSMFNGSCISQTNVKSKLLGVKVEYVGESDKAPPIVIFGTKKPNQLQLFERFYYVSSGFLDTTINIIDKYSANKVSQRMATLVIKLKYEVNDTRIYLADSQGIMKLLLNIIDQCKISKYNQLKFDLERISKMY